MRIATITVGALSLILLALLLNGVYQARKAVNRSLQKSELNKIKYATRASLQNNGAFPPRFSIHPENGVKTNWSVLIEIAMESELASNYDRSQEWDSSKNLAAFERPSFVRWTAQMPHNSENVAAATFVAVANMDTVLNNEDLTSAQQIRDGSENTLLVAEISKSTIPWAAPTALTFNDFAGLCSKSDHQIANGSAQIGFEGQLLLFADFEIYRVLEPLPQHYFRALWTKDGGESVTRTRLVELRLLQEAF